jgi:hypothetical protein
MEFVIRWTEVASVCCFRGNINKVIRKLLLIFVICSLVPFFLIVNYLCYFHVSLLLLAVQHQRQVTFMRVIIVNVMRYRQDRTESG